MRPAVYKNILFNKGEDIKKTVSVLEHVIDGLQGTGVYEKYGPNIDVHLERDLAQCIGDLAFHLQRVCELGKIKGW